MQPVQPSSSSSLPLPVEPCVADNPEPSPLKKKILIAICTIMAVGLALSYVFVPYLWIFSLVFFTGGMSAFLSLWRNPDSRVFMLVI